MPKRKSDSGMTLIFYESLAPIRIAGGKAWYYHVRGKRLEVVVDSAKFISSDGIIQFNISLKRILSKELQCQKGKAASKR